MPSRPLRGSRAGRLRFDEVLYVTEMARRIAAIHGTGNRRGVVADAIDWKSFKGD